MYIGAVVVLLLVCVCVCEGAAHVLVDIFGVFWHRPPIAECRPKPPPAIKSISCKDLIVLVQIGPLLIIPKWAILYG